MSRRKYTLIVSRRAAPKRNKCYVYRQHIGNLGTIETRLVSVHAYGVLVSVTLPVLFEVFKRDRRLKAR